VYEGKDVQIKKVTFIYEKRCIYEERDAQKRQIREKVYIYAHIGTVEQQKQNRVEG